MQGGNQFKFIGTNQFMNFDSAANNVISGSAAIGGKYYPADKRKIVNIICDENVSFKVDITDPHGSLTCGWLL